MPLNPEPLFVLAMSFADFRDVREYVAIGPFSDPDKAEESLVYMSSRANIAKATIRKASDVPRKYQPLLADLACECAADKTVGAQDDGGDVVDLFADATA